MTQLSGAELAELVLHGPRLTLRPWRPDDATAVHALLADDDLRAAVRLSDPYTVADAEYFVTGFAPERRAAAISLECALENDGVVVGSAALRLSTETHAASIGYWVAPDAQGHGFAAEATHTLARWGFEHGQHRIEIETDVQNLGSARVALRCGFGFESIRRDARPVGTAVHDLAVFVRTADDPERSIAPVFPPIPDGLLSDGTVALRTMVAADLEPFAEQETDPLTRQVGFTGAAPPRRAMEHLIARAGLDRLVGPAAGFTIVDVATGSFAGSVRLRVSGPPKLGGIGYAIHPAFRGRGYTSRALRLLTPWAFEVAEFARLELGAKVTNVASQRAALSAGFEPDGVARARLRNADGTFSDEARFCLINPRYC